MANKINPRRHGQCRESHGSTCRTNYCKGVRASHKFEKREWNRHVRQNAHVICKASLEIHATHKGTYSRRVGREIREVVPTLRPWMD